MNVLAEVIDESIRGMEGGLVSKAEQEKVGSVSKLVMFEEKQTLAKYWKGRECLSRATRY